MLEDTHSKPRQEVVIVNSYGDENRGSAALNAAAIIAVRSNLSEAQVRLVSVHDPAEDDYSHIYRHTINSFPEVVIDPPPVIVRSGRAVGLRKVARQIAYLLVPYRTRLPTALQAIRSADLVVSRGGYVFVGGNNYRNALSLFSIAFPLLYAKRLRKRTVTLPTSIGPLGRSKIHNRVLAMILRAVDLVVSRDPISVRAALELGVDARKLLELPDSVFLLGAPGRRRRQRPSQVLALTERQDARSARTLLVQVSEALLSAGVISHCVGVPQVDADIPATAVVVDDINRVADSAAYMVREDLSVEELIEVYADAQVTLSHHLHACVLSMIAGTPAIAVTTDGAKIEGIYASLGLPRDWVVSVDTPAEVVADRVAKAIDDAELVQEAVAEAARKLAAGLTEVISAPPSESGS